MKETAKLFVLLFLLMFLINMFYFLKNNEGYCDLMDVNNLTIFIGLNSSYYNWGDGVKVYGSVVGKDGENIENYFVEIFLEGQKVCSSTINISGQYECEFLAPNKIGNFKVLANLTDKSTGESFTNSTTLIVKFVYGGKDKEIEKASSVSCYEAPQLIVNPDGSIKVVYLRICIW